MTLGIVRAGLFTTVQDLGRRGWQHEGVPVAGPMDDVAFRLANWLVGNAGHEAVLEATLAGPAIRAERDALVAVTGADMDARVGTRRIRPWHTVLLRAGEVLTLDGARQGCRAYMAVAGGIDVEPVLGSRSTYTRARLGGVAGRPLERGDVLPVGDASRAVRPRGIDVRRFRADHRVARFLPGPHWGSLDAASRRSFLEGAYVLRNDSDRMGLRLAGEPLRMQDAPEPLSAGVSMGTIQLPAGGQPIVLMADRQTTGGYPRIGEVATVDLPVLAQLRPGEEVRFEAISPPEAERLYLLRENELALLRRLLMVPA